MAQTPEGAEKVAARRAGLTVEEYRGRRAAGLKRCIKCKAWKPVSDFNADRSRGDGLTARCRRCSQLTDGPSDTDRATRRAAGEEWCRGCKAWLPTTACLRKQGSCQPCVNRDRRERYAADPQFRHKLKQSTYQRKRMVDAVPPVGERFLTMLFDGQCAYCGSPAEAWDHITPVVKGGRTTPGNILPACKSCNSSKGDRDVYEWMESRGIEPTDLLWDRLVFQHVSPFG